MNGLSEQLASNPAPANPALGVGAIVVLALTGLVVSWVLQQLVIWYCARNRATMRAPESHHAPTTEVIPRFGGLGLAGALVAILLSHAFQSGWQQLLNDGSLAILVTSLGMFAVGFWDDLKPLGARKKLLLQIIIAAAAYLLGLQVNSFKNPFTGQIFDLHSYGIFLTVFWLVAMTNLINLVDGIDGLAGGVTLMLMCLLAYVSYGNSSVQLVIATGMAGALLSFLRFNFPPARIYMGDGGAYFLGFLIGAMTIANSHKGTVLAAMIAPVIALGLPIIDTALAIARRGLKGLPLFRADRKHLHHRLMQRGLSRTKTVLLLYAISVVFLLMAFAMFWSEQRYTPIAFGLAFLIFLFLLQGRAMGLDWLTVGRAVGNSRQLRRRTQYVMTLGCWLEMEGERHDTLDGLWEDFTFMARKVGFTRAEVVLADGHRTWQGDAHDPKTAQREHVFEFNPGTRMLVILQASETDTDRYIYSHLGEWAAEAWLKAVIRWRDTKQKPISFGDKATSGHANPVGTTPSPISPG